MSISTMISDFLDKTTAARFKRDGQNRLVFFPWGFGTGRVVPDADTEARLRNATRRMMIIIFTVVIPVVSIVQAVFHFSGLQYVIYLAACCASGFVLQLDLLRLTRGLAMSGERLSYAGAMTQSLDRFGSNFLIFGLITSVVLAAVGALMLVVPAARAESNWIASVFCLAVFAPLAAVYAVALKKRRTAERNGAH